MQRIHRTKYYVMIIITSLLIMAGNLIDSSEQLLGSWGGAWLALLALLLGNISAGFLSKNILRSRSIRRIIAGKSWVEGYWDIITHSDDESDNPMCARGILVLDYDVDADEMKAVTTRYAPDGTEYIVNSQVAYVREEGANLRYLNFFRLDYGDDGPQYGMAFSELSRQCPLSSKTKQTYEGTVALQIGSRSLRQSAKKIPDAQVRKLIEKYSDRWMYHYLEDNSIQSKSIAAAASD